MFIFCFYQLIVKLMLLKSIIIFVICNYMIEILNINMWKVYVNYGTLYEIPKFALLSERNATQKIEVHLDKTKVAENDPTFKFTNKIRKILCRVYR